MIGDLFEMGGRIGQVEAKLLANEIGDAAALFRMKTFRVEVGSLRLARRYQPLRESTTHQTKRTIGDALERIERRIVDLIWDIDGQFDKSNSPMSLFILMSLSVKDRERLEAVHELFISEGFPVWWCFDLPPGADWRSVLDEQLQKAAAVVTFWTEESVRSTAVTEEAAVGQKGGKLLHVLMDDVTLPYGFSETQYADLRNWDGSALHPEYRKLSQAIRDKLNPPTPEEINQRIVAAAPIAATIEDGRITARDAPPTAKPLLTDEFDLEQRLEAQATLAEKANRAITSLDNNLGDAIRLDIDHFLNQARRRPASWYTLTDSISDLRFYLRMGDELSWPGSSRNMIENLCDRHEALRPYLQPVQPSAVSSPSLPVPMFGQDSYNADLLGMITSKAIAAFESVEAAHVLAEPARKTAEYFTGSIEQALSSQPSSEPSDNKRLAKIRRGLLDLAGFIGSVIVSIGAGVAGNLLTSVTAAKTLKQTLEKIMNLLTDLF